MSFCILDFAFWIRQRYTFIMISLSAVKNAFLDILFPASCVNCGAEGTYFCQDCASLVEIFEDQYCPFCRIPKIVPDGRTCVRCRKDKKLNGLFCATSYENKLVRKMLQLLKYKPSYAKCLAEPLVSFIITHFQLVNKIDFSKYLWIPVPLHKSRLKERGFNQAEELTKNLSENLGGRLASAALVKKRPTKDQVGLPREERKKNVEGAFSCVKPETVKGEKILLVDDVFTTGATMEECARALKRAGAKEVWGVTVARG